MADDQDWRAKYRNLALEVEQYEQQRDQELECLRNLAVQFDLVVHGQYPRLDQLLTSLEADLQAGRLAGIPELLRQAEKYVRMLDERRMHHARQLLAGIDEWAQLLLQQIPEEESGVLLDVRHRLSVAEDDTHELPDLMEQLLKLQRRLEMRDASYVDTGRRLARRMLQLVRQLQVPDSCKNRVDALIEELEGASDVATLEGVIDEVILLAQVCGSRMEVEIHEYLEGLNTQLASLRGFLDRAEASEARQLERSNQLDKAVRQDVRDISQTVKHSRDLDELKASVNTQLVRLIKAVNTHREMESRHIAELRQERQQLQQRLDEMEHLAEGFRRSAEEAHMKSLTDSLTGLANRFAYSQQLSMELDRFKRYGTPFSISIVDIDFFKRVNDQYGHLAGDKVLRLLANILRSNTRSVDFIARFGGEEFVILMPSTRGEAALEVAEKLRLAVEQSPFNFHGQPVGITISSGVAEVASEDSTETLFTRADTNLYTAKSQGRNQVVLS